LINSINFGQRLTQGVVHSPFNFIFGFTKGSNALKEWIMEMNVDRSNEISSPNGDEPIYLKRSATFYKVYGGLFVFSILMNWIGKPIFKGQQETLDLLVGIPILMVFVMAPIGLFYSWKSYQRKEGRSITRFKYFLGHFFFCLLVIAMITVLVSDLSRIDQQ
jgi:hypothetical protein